MFEVGFWELSLIGVIALLVIGPERLPGAARTVGLYVGRIRRYVQHVRSDIERELHAEELRRMVDNPGEGGTLSGLRDVVNETRDALDTVKQDFQAAQKEAEDVANPSDWTSGLAQPEPPSSDGTSTSAEAASSGETASLGEPYEAMPTAADETAAAKAPVVTADGSLDDSAADEAAENQTPAAKAVEIPAAAPAGGDRTPDEVPASAPAQAESDAPATGDTPAAKVMEAAPTEPEPEAPAAAAGRAAEIPPANRQGG